MISNFDKKKLLKIIQSLDVNKAHGYDSISLRMLKLNSSSIIKRLSIIFQNCLKSSTFPDDWKKRITVQLHKKSSKQLVNNPPPYLNNSEIKLSSSQKHLGVSLDSKLSFNKHIDDKTHQVKKGVGLLRKLHLILPSTRLTANCS